MLLFIVPFLISALAVYIWIYYENVKRYPKGPLPVPIFGNLLTVNAGKLHEQISDYAKDYGSVYTVWLPNPTVVITDYDLIKEAFAKKGYDFAGRPQGYPNDLLGIIKNGGIIRSEGENWKEQRTTSLHILRDLGMGKDLMEEQVLLSAQEFLVHMASIKDKETMDLQRPLQVFIANIIHKILFGCSHEYDESDHLMQSVDNLMQFFNDTRNNKIMLLCQMIPGLDQLPIINRLARGRFMKTIDVVKNNIKEDVRRCLKTYSADEEPECFVHAYYQRMHNNSNLDYDNLLSVCMDFFVASMEMTPTTLYWGSLLLATNTEVQDKIRAEIMSVLGPDGQPSASLRNRMPYTYAAIQEIQRYANIVPLNILHRTTRDTSIGNIRIPNDTQIIGHINHVMARSPVFENPKKFKPERFLMEDGLTLNRETVEKLCPFSIGKRQCAGEALARVELFIGLVTLLQNYEIEPAEGHKVDLEPIYAAVLLPKPQPLRLTLLSSEWDLNRNYSSITSDHKLHPNKTDSLSNF
ncbi:unnamed protein product [Cylicocyclus nassatus]|uniref:Unspecific monooxygenase n=1 Tax=Cylicocyclus nassatus TaxID=53992 RepID=A0AA36DT89_CYLNA|nr:unnamed protein product [Cylicocyclus nassatus]